MRVTHMTFEKEDLENNKKEEKKKATKKFKDRKLGDEWADWEGNIEAQIDVSQPKSKFIWIASVLLLLILLGSWGVWFLISPRIQQLGSTPTFYLKILFWGGVGLFALFYLLVLVEIATGKIAFFPYRVSEGFLLFLLPKIVWLGNKIGLSRDQIGNAFIKANNALTASYNKKLNRSKILVLLPRCLKKEVRKSILSMVEGYDCAVHTVGGGEQARQAVIKEKPTCIIALACERDLVSGIKDVALKIPVMGIPNQRPEGPCKNTLVDLKMFEEILHQCKPHKILAENKTNYHPDNLNNKR
ncbi:MAG: hypothetical protein DRG59_10290 [Deltaproteobacteria bacterium]|nr:MAG: hypothetical protein DRG59_10290 [Deltaproteobacteria bacterium]